MDNIFNSCNNLFNIIFYIIMKNKFLDLVNQIEQQHITLGNLIVEFKNALIDFDNLSNPAGLLLVSGSIRKIDELIKCVKPNIRVFVYKSTWSLNMFKSKLAECLYGIESDQLSLVGWLFDNNNQNLKLCSDYEIVLNDNHNVKQYQSLIDIINSISPYVDKSKTNRFDLISCNLESEPYAHMVKILELGTDFIYAYSNDLTGNVPNSDWVLEHLNIDLLDTYFDKSKIANLKVDIVFGTTSQLVNNAFLTTKNFTSLQQPFIINAGFYQDEITKLLLKYNQAQITNLVTAGLNKDQIITLANANFTYLNITYLLTTKGFNYNQINNLMLKGYNVDQIMILVNNDLTYDQIYSMINNILSNTNYLYNDITNLLNSGFRFGNIIKMVKINLTPTQINAILSKGYTVVTLMIIVNLINFTTDQKYSLAYTNNYSCDQIYNLVSAEFTYEQILKFSSTQLRDFISKGFTYNQILKMILGNYSYNNICDLLNTKGFTYSQVVNMVSANYSYIQICNLLNTYNFESSQIAIMAVAKFSYNQLIKLYNKGYVSTELVSLISKFTNDQIIAIADANWKSSQITDLLSKNFTSNQIIYIINAKLTFDQVNTLLSATYGITKDQLIIVASYNYTYDQINDLLKTRLFIKSQLVTLANNNYSYTNIIDLLDKRSFTKDNINNLAAKNVTYIQIIDLINNKKFTRDELINLLITKTFTVDQVILFFKANLSYTQITNYLSTHTNDQTINYAHNIIIVNNKYTTTEINNLLTTYTFNYDQIILMVNANLSYAQITNLITNGFKPLYLITSNLSSSQLEYITRPYDYNTSTFVQILTSEQVVSLFKAGLTSGMFNMTNSTTVSGFKATGFNYTSIVALLNLRYSSSLIINLIAQNEISYRDFTNLHYTLLSRGFTLQQINDFLRYLSISKLRDLTSIDWVPSDVNKNTTMYKHVIFKPNPNPGNNITGIDISNFYFNIANTIANGKTPLSLSTQFPQTCDLALYLSNNPGKTEDDLIFNLTNAGIDVYIVSTYTDSGTGDNLICTKESLKIASTITKEGIAEGYKAFANGLASTLSNSYGTMSELQKLDFSSPEFAAALGSALQSSPYFKSASTDKVGNFLKSVGAKINSYANKEISVLESNVAKYASVVENSAQKITTDLVNIVANSDELKKLKSGITLVSKDMTKFASKFGNEFKTAMDNAPWTEISAYLEEVSAYLAAFDPTGLGGLAFAVKDLTESSIAFKADKSNDNLFALVFSVINCVLALIGVLMFVAGGAASIAKKMVFEVLDRLVVPLLSAYGAIVPALITYINDPKGGEAPQTNQQALIDACIQSGIGIAMAQA